MTGLELKAALAAGRTKPGLVIDLIKSGYGMEAAWLMVRAATVAHLAERLFAMATGPAADDDVEATRIMLSARLNAEADELLTLATPDVPHARRAPERAA